MTVDIDRLVEISEKLDFDDGFCTSTLEKIVFSTSSLTKATEMIFEAAAKNAVCGLSEQSVFIDQFNNKLEFAYGIGYEVLEAFIELTINFIFYQILAFTFESSCIYSNFCISASSFQLFKALKIAFKLLKVINTGVNGNVKKAVKLFFKYSSKELGKTFGKTLVPIPLLGNIIGSLLGGIGMRIFM